jgi:hypothetical protein
MAPESGRQSQEKADSVTPAGLFSRSLRTSKSIGTGNVWHNPLGAAACVVFGAMGLIGSFYSDESDGTKMMTRAVRAVGFLILAGALNGYS